MPVFPERLRQVNVFFQPPEAKVAERLRMDERFRREMQAAWQTRLAADEVNAPPATEDQLQAFEVAFGPIPDEFRWFLSACGGGPVGSEWVDSIDELPDTHRKFREEVRMPHGWTLADTFVIGWDGGGNPYGIHAPTGRLLVEDHDFGGIHEMAPSFAAFLARGLSLDTDTGSGIDQRGK